MADNAEPADTKETPDKSAGPKRKPIPGDFSYTTTPGKLKSALQAITVGDRPEHVNKDYVSAYLGVTGGSAIPIPAILRKVGFLGSDNRPSDQWAKFQSEGTRPAAALEGLRKGFPEIFKRHTYAHTLDEPKIRDIIVEITGRAKSDPVIGQIYGTFDAFRSFVPNGFQSSAEAISEVQSAAQTEAHGNGNAGDNARHHHLGLSYHINIVLPETKDIAVFNAIFQSLRKNLLA